jgi:uncharacterized protein (TIGR02145 family)
MKNKKSTKLRLASLLPRTSAVMLIFMTMFTTCGPEPETQVIEVVKVTLDKPTLTLEVGQSEKLTATILPIDAVNQVIEWTSNDNEVATVEDGEVKAIKAGNATITVTTDDGDLTATCAVSVVDAAVKVESISLDKPTLDMEEGDIETLTFTIMPANATNQDVRWESSDDKIATVANGEVTAVKAGNAIITVITLEGDKTAKCEITITEPFISITDMWIDKPSLTLLEGEEETIVPTITPSDATNQTIIWDSTDDNVAIVDGGKITAVKAGTATITAITQDGNIKDECLVTVNSAEHPIFGVVSFRTETTWPIGSQTWSDVVVATGCAKDTFDGGTSSAPKIDCRQNGNYGHLFSWEAVSQYKDLLCPEGWRVPTSEDFCELDKALNNDDSCGLRTGAPALTYISTWGGEYSGRCTETGWPQNVGNAGYYWTETIDVTNTDYVIYLYLHRAGESSNPTSQSSKAYGSQLRCVK